VTRDFTNARSRAAAFRLPSRRCDCGEQLRLALALLEDLGGAIILYLTREGRRLGLANKMRTYQLQNDGLDTFDAATTLGFDDDERDYGIVARMLRMLNCTRTVLFTNDRARHAARGAYQCRKPPLYDGEGSACRTGSII
jgi:GTP cyclohydrolase II